MKRFLVLLAFAVLAVSACKKAEEKAVEPAYFMVTPKSADSENGFPHSIDVKVTCDIAFEYALEDGSWITINAGEKDDKNVTPIELVLSVNDGEAPRKDVFTVTAGTKKFTLSITQKTVASAATVQDVHLKYIFPKTVMFQFPAAWSLSSDAAWLEFDPSEGAAGVLTNVTFKAKEFNFTGSERTTDMLISFESASLTLPVIQEDSNPSGDFAQKLPGLYHYDKSGSSIIYDPLAHQTNLVKKTDGSIFRLVNPGEEKMYEISGLPASYAIGDSLHLTIYQNWVTAMDFRTEKDVWVLKTEDSLAWLLDSDEHGYVVKK